LHIGKKFEASLIHEIKSWQIAEIKLTLDNNIFVERVKYFGKNGIAQNQYLSIEPW